MCGRPGFFFRLIKQKNLLPMGTKDSCYLFYKHLRIHTRNINNIIFGQKENFFYHPTAAVRNITQLAYKEYLVKNSCHHAVFLCM